MNLESFARFLPAKKIKGLMTKSVGPLYDTIVEAMDPLVKEKLNEEEEGFMPAFMRLPDNRLIAFAVGYDKNKKPTRIIHGWDVLEIFNGIQEDEITAAKEFIGNDE